MYIIMERQKPYGYIYKIEFPNGKVYIGLTTTSLKQRKSGHRNCAKRNINRPLYNALRRYTMEDTFELMEIDTADTEEELCRKEIMYISKYNSFDIKYGYNMTLGGEGPNGWVPSQEQRQNMSEAQKKYWENSEVRERRSEVRKKYFRETPGAREKLNEVGKKYWENPGAREKNSEALKKHYEDNPEAKLKMSEIKKAYNKEHPEAAKNRLDTMGKNKPFDVFTIDGTFIKSFTYQIDAIEYLQREHNITGTIQVCTVLNGKRKSCLGFAFIYKDDPDAEKKILELKNKKRKNKPFDVFTIDGTFIKSFTYQIDAIEYLQREHNITGTIKVCAVLNGNRKSSAGFVFIYKDDPDAEKKILDLKNKKRKNY